MPIIITLLTLVALALLYLFLAAPNTRRAVLPDARLIAHRGLFDQAAGVPENSLAAFEAACRAGYAIELDVQITGDDVAVVFHDDDIQRLCGVPGDIRQMRFAELKDLRLSGTDHRIPTFSEVLSLVDGRTSLLVELKTNERRQALVAKAIEPLLDYAGAYVVESFDPLILGQLKRVRPEIPRGQLVPTDRFPLNVLALNFISRPDFVAYSKDKSGSLPIQIQRHLFKTPLAVWTLKSYAELEAEKDRAQMLIFDGFRP